MATPNPDQVLNEQLDKFYKDKLYPEKLARRQLNESAKSNVLAQVGAQQAQAARANLGSTSNVQQNAASRMRDNLARVANQAGIEAQAQSNAQTDANQKVIADQILKLAERKKQRDAERDAQIASNVSSMLTFGGQAVGALTAVI